MDRCFIHQTDSVNACPDCIDVERREMHFMKIRNKKLEAVAVAAQGLMIAGQHAWDDDPYTWNEDKRDIDAVENALDALEDK